MNSAMFNKLFCKCSLWPVVAGVVFYTCAHFLLSLYKFLREECLSLQLKIKNLFLLSALSDFATHILQLYCLVNIYLELLCLIGELTL